LFQTDYGIPIDEIYEGVHDGPVLGTGVSGVVRKVKHRRTGVAYAVKCLDLGLIRDERGLQALRDEIFIMCHLDHPNIVRLDEVYESRTEIYLIQELCWGGDLFDRLDEQPDYHYSEASCARLVKQMLSSVRYLHSKNIIHRDLKLENFLFSSTDPDSELKMIDFGLSKHFTFLGEVQHECVGTPYTVAPEVIRAEYDEKIDIWALGVIAYLLLSGETPFGGVDGECLETVRVNILKGTVVFEPEELWQHVSEAGKTFIKRLLNPEASKRPTAKEVQSDPWLQTYGKKGTDEGAKLSPKLIQALVEFREYTDMRKVLCEVLSFTLLPEQIAELRKEFEKIDHDGDGEISLSELKQVLAEKAGYGSLGALTEGQVDDLFNALRLRKSDPTIRWHEFIAAGLSQCNFDERNLKLAFDRLDYDRTG
jgi:calcium-dependent protein kinase